MFVKKKRKKLEILVLSDSHEKAAAGRISWFDSRVEAFIHISACQWGYFTIVGTASDDTEIISQS